MADDPGKPRRVPSEELRALAEAIFSACGMTTADAVLLTDTLIAADLGGTHSHGVLRVPEYLTKLTTGGVDPRGRPSVVHERGGCLVVSGGNSMGQIGSAFAMAAVLDRAEEHGIAAAAIRDSNHNGAVGYYAAMAPARGMIGICTTNALPTMAPWGGAERLLGIDPLSVAIPAGQEHSIVYDAAFSGSSHGKLRVHARRGLPIPPDWALDRDGQPTTDPVEAIEGLLQPIGGYKGAGLAMVMGILSSMLSGAAYGTELGDLEAGPRAGQDGHFVAAIDVAAFEDVETFKSRVDGAIRQIHASRRAPGVNRIYAPGEKEQLTRMAFRREGIPLDDVTLGGLREAADRVGISASSPGWLQ